MDCDAEGRWMGVGGLHYFSKKENWMAQTTEGMGWGWGWGGGGGQQTKKKKKMGG